MEQRKFGATGLTVSVLGLGTAGIGFRQTSDATLDALLGSAATAGMNVIDTAAMYMDAEASLGRTLAGRREAFLIFTKCCRHVPRLPLPGRVLRKLNRPIAKFRGQEPAEWHPRTLRWNIEESLRRLRTDRLDLLQLHSCTEQQLARGELIEVLTLARSAGKVRYIGFSGDGNAAQWAARSGEFDAIQTSINIADQQAIETVLPLVSIRNAAVIAKRPLANFAWTSANPPTDAAEKIYCERLRKLDYDFLRGSDAPGARGPMPAAKNARIATLYRGLSP